MCPLDLSKEGKITTLSASSSPPAPLTLRLHFKPFTLKPPLDPGPGLAPSTAVHSDGDYEERPHLWGLGPL